MSTSSPTCDLAARMYEIKKRPLWMALRLAGVEYMLSTQTGSRVRVIAPADSNVKNHSTPLLPAKLTAKVTI